MYYPIPNFVNIYNFAIAKNLAQGFPDWETPEFVREYMTQAINKNENQYIRVAGHPNLVKEIAKTYGPKFNRTLDPLTEVKKAFFDV